MGLYFILFGYNMILYRIFFFFLYPKIIVAVSQIQNAKYYTW